MSSRSHRQVNYLDVSGCQRSDLARPTGRTSEDERLDANPARVKEVLAAALPDSPYRRRADKVHYRAGPCNAHCVVS
jgi:hypothetical protein